MNKIRLLIILVLSVVTSAMAQQMRFHPISIEQGLSHGWVNCFCQDYLGFIWIGTDDGLNRFDGYDFYIYRQVQNNESSLLSSTIISISEDNTKNLWIGTAKGLSRYNRKTGKFETHKKWPQKCAIYQVLDDCDKRIWVAASNGLWNIDLKTDSFEKFKPKENDINSISGSSIRSIHYDKRNHLWIAANKGICLYLKDNKTFKRYFHENPMNKENANIRCMIMDKQERIWLGTDEGLECFVNAKEIPETGEFIHFKNDANNPNSIAVGAVQTLELDSENKLWIGTENGGLQILDLNTSDLKNPVFHHYIYDPSDIRSINNNSIYSIFQDKQKNIWIGTFGKGINLVTPKAEKFAHHYHETERRYSIENNQVNTFYSDDKYLWIGTEGGISRFNKDGKYYEHFTHNTSANSIGANAVWALLKDSKGNFWAGTWGGGLNLYNPKTNTFTRFQHNKDDKKSLPSNNIFALFEDSKHRIWVGTMGGGLCQLDDNHNVVKTYSKLANNHKQNHVHQIVEDKNGNLWVANPELLSCINPEKETVKYYQYKPKDKNSLSGNKIYTVFIDSKQNMWVGTENGLNLYSPNSDNFKLYNTDNGLPDNSVKSIIEDNDGNLWLGTNRGLSKFLNAVNLPVLVKFRNYTPEDGLQGYDFSWRSCAKDKEGNIFFGGNNGYNVFQPASLNENHIPPEIVFTDFLLFNKSITEYNETSPLKEPILSTKEITLTYKQSVFSFRFAAINYISTAKNQYAYIMEGFEKKWNYVGTKREATYTNLDPGEYTFKVIASNNDGVWNKKGISIKLIILPPFWKTWWFRTLAILFIVTCAVGYYLVKMGQMKRQKIILEQKVKERTAQLQEANNQLKEHQDEIIQQNEEIRQQAEELQAQSEILANQNEKLIELDKFKETITGSIVHDLKNPLNSVIVLSELMLPFEDNAENAMNLKMMNQSGKQMLQMVMNILDVQKFESAKMKVEKEELNLLEIIRSSINQVPLLLEQKEIEVHISIAEEINIQGDSGLLTRVFTNLLTNAIKFTPKKGNIYIEAKTSKEGTVIISVKDTGCGIRAEKLITIFEKFSQAEARDLGQTKSTGLGLNFCKMAVEAHGGRIWVESEVGKGSEFFIELS